MNPNIFERSIHCVRCFTETKDSYQDIFDSDGKELELQKLLEICFNVNVKYDENNILAICNDCLDELIETYDVMKKDEEELMSCLSEEEATECKYKIENSIEETDIETGSNEDREYEEEQTHSHLYENNDCKDENFMENANNRGNVHESSSSVLVLENEEREENIYFTESEEEYETDTNNIHETLSMKLNEKEVSFEEYVEENSEDENKEDVVDTVEEVKIEKYTKEGEQLLNGERHFNASTVTYNSNWNSEDIRQYKSTVIQSNFSDICFPQDIQCCICRKGLQSHLDIVSHIRNLHSVDEFAFPCIIDTNCAPMKSLNDFIYHLVFRHYELDGLTMISYCPECRRSFQSFMAYNKHSCLRGAKLSRLQTECEICGKAFRSNKRYRFHLQFHLERHRPPVCFVCDEKFEDEDNFFEHIMYRHEKDPDLYCLLCDKCFLSKKNLQDHMYLHTKKRPFMCTYCSKTYISKTFLNDHLISKHSAMNPHKCHICNKIFAIKHHLKKHVENHTKPKATDVVTCSMCGLVACNDEEAEEHLQLHNDEAETIIENIEIAYCCEYCDSSFSSLLNLVRHRSEHDDNKYYCNWCQRIFDDFKTLNTHRANHIEFEERRSVFPVVRHYVCNKPNCTKSYLLWASLRTHKKYRHKILDDSYVCPKCIITFETKQEFEEHMGNYHREGAYECTTCRKCFKTKLAFTFHVMKAHKKEPVYKPPKLKPVPEKKAKCSLCSDAFNNEAQLERHKIVVHYKLKCKICKSILKNLKSYKGHMREVHAKEKNFACKYCGKKFVNRCRQLAHEEKVHEKVKKYNCSLCPYAAYYKHSFTLHMRSHQNERPYLCDLCGKGFIMNCNLQIHLRRHYGIKNFVCDYENCSLRFPAKALLSAHIKKRHSTGKKNELRARSKNKAQRSKFQVPLVETFIDDDDGLEFDEEEKIVKEIKAEDDEDIEIEYETIDESAENDLIDEEYVLEEIEDHIEIRNSNEIFALERRSLQRSNNLASHEKFEEDTLQEIINEIAKESVIVQKNNSDHDYNVLANDQKVYGNTIEKEN